MTTPPTSPHLAFDTALLARARALALSGQCTLLEALDELAACTPADFAQRLGNTFGLALVDMPALRAGQPRFDVLPFAECTQRGVFAFETHEGALIGALTNPFDEQTLAWMLRQAQAPAQEKGRGRGEFHLRLAQRADMTAVLAHHEESMRAMQNFSAEATTPLAEGGIALDLSIASITEDTHPVVRLVNSTVYDALKLGASDIHLESAPDALHIKYRIDGVLVEVARMVGTDLAAQVISRIKVLADLDIAERRIPQDGRFKVRIKGTDIDFRVSVIPSIYGEDAVLRLLDRRPITNHAMTEAPHDAPTLTLENLRLDAHTIKTLRQLATRAHGLLLVTGPTGSGKTTTLYAAITEINTGRDKIVTIEDPVEYRLPGVLQIPVNEKKGLTFARGLRSVLRHDPDKIMVGEIRDPETAQIAVQAALTGHLVFTTVHANSVFDVLSRFVHMEVDPYSLASALNGIAAQRLLRRNCPQCTAPAAPTPEALEALALTPLEVQGWRFQAGVGCGHCRGTGYKGRQAVAEVLVLDDHLRDLIATKAPLTQLKEEARARGLRTVRQRALELVAAGETTLAEVQRVAAG